MSSIGIMQGRLLPPVGGRIQAFPAERWHEEFALAASAGLACIEWIYESPNDANPLATRGGILAMREATDRSGVVVRSVCADYFMDQTLVRATPVELNARVAHLGWLMEQCRQAGITRIVLPFVDQSAIRSAAEQDDVVGTLMRVLPHAERLGIELHLETSLRPASFAAMLDRLPPQHVRVNYDSGNSASCGYAVADEFQAYGVRIGSVHIKDRVAGGGTVPLGTGDADFDDLFASLTSVGYAGDFILQVARDEAGDEVRWARRNRDFVVGYLE